MAIIPPPTPSEHKILHFKSIGDNLTEEEYNGIVSLLRHFNKHTETFRINETVTGEYGDYLFDLEDVTFLDNGILVSEDTILAEPKVKLTNADFKNSKYILQLKVLHYSDVNILEDMSITDYKVIETIEVELTEDVWVDIPLTGLEEDYIILYDCNILISHDNTIVTGVWVDDVDLTVDETTVDVGDTITLTATVSDNHGDSVSGVTVTFKNGATTLGTASTNSSGVATYNYTTTAGGVLSLTATANSLVSDVVEVTVEGVVPSSISLISDKDILSYADGQSATLTATVLGSDSQPYEGATVVFKAYKDGTLVETIGSDTTDASGVASVSYSSKGAGDLSIQCECMNLQETYSIIDASYYNPNTITGSDSASHQQNLFPNPTGNFEIDYTCAVTPTGNNAYVQLSYGENSNTRVLNGIIVRSDGFYILDYGGSAGESNKISISANTEYNVKYTYVNGVNSITVNNQTVTLTRSINPLFNQLSLRNGSVKNIIIKPL